jgi:hypothetical protein
MAQSSVVCHGRCPAFIRGLILDVADVRLERRQPTLVDQAIIPAAINIAGGVFTAVAGDNLTDQLEVLVVHVGHFFAFSQAGSEGGWLRSALVGAAGAV